MQTLEAAQTIQGVAGTASVVNCTIWGDEKDTTTGANVYKKLFAGLLPNATAVLATVPAGKAWLVTSIDLQNTSASLVTGIKLFENGSTAATQITAPGALLSGGSASRGTNGWNTMDGGGSQLVTSAITATGDATGSGASSIALTVVALQGRAISASAPSINDALVWSGTAWAPVARFQSVAATDASISVAGTAVNPTLATGRLDQIATLHPPTAAVALNAQKITGLADGTANTDAVTLQQLNNAVTGLLDYRGTFDASFNLAPTTGGSGAAGAVAKGDFWVCSVAGTLPSQPSGTKVASPGDLIIALADVPGQTSASWDVVEHDVGYAPEDSANKSNDTTLAADSATLYPTQHAVKTYAQPLDATLTALAGQNWVLNSTPIGTGADTMTQLALSANTTAGRSSTGNIVAKSVTDAGWAWLAAADATAETALLNSATTVLKGLLDPGDKTKLNNTTNTNSGDLTLTAVGAAPNNNGATLAGQALTLQPADGTHPGLLPSAQAFFLLNYSGSGIIFVTANAYQNLAVDGATDDQPALNTLMGLAPDGSTLVWPGQNRTMVLSGAGNIPAGKHFRFVGGGNGGKTHILSTSLTANHFTVNDWYSTFEGFDFVNNNTTTTGVQALTSGTVLNVAGLTTALIPGSGSINIGSAIGWQVLTYSARTSTTVTLSSTGTGNSIAGAPVVFKTAGAAVAAGNNVGIDCIGNTFSYVFNGYVASGTTANQSTAAHNGFLNTINFDIQIDAVNWNGIIDSNTCDCTTNSRTLSHCEINQCGSITGQGNQFIRGQFNMRLGSTTAAYPAGVFGVYFTNSFFDNAGTDAIKIQGISAVQRIKLTSCWLSSAAAMGLNFASTATTLPSDIELIGCNIYSNGSNGIGGAGVADYKVIGGQIAGNVTGVNIAPATGNVYSVLLSAVRIGPTGGIGVNTTGIAIATGTYAQIKIADCDATGNTTNLTLGTVTPVTASRYAITDNPGINPHGSVGTIAVPTSTTVRTNDTGFRVNVFAKAGTTAPTVVTVNGVNTVLPAVSALFPFVLEPGGTIAMTYTVAPTWTWVAN